MNQKYLILQHCPVEFIIGLPTMRQYDLTAVFRDYFTLRHKHFVANAGRSAKDIPTALPIIEATEFANTRSVRAGTLITPPIILQTEGRQDPPAAGLSALCTACDSHSPGTAAQTVEGGTSLSMPQSDSAYWYSNTDRKK